MKTKMFEIRDRVTFIPVLCIEIDCGNNQAESFLIRAAGFAGGSRLIQLVSFNKKQSHWDVYAWGDRTYAVAHNYITDNWDTLQGGEVIDVEFILCETKKPKTSERLD